MTADDCPYEVVCSNGDRITAPDLAHALRGAKQMYEDHLTACQVIGRGRDLTFTFTRDGIQVQTLTTAALHRT